MPRPRVPTLGAGTGCSADLRRVSSARDAERRSLARPRRAWGRGRAGERRGAVYIAVLGTSLIISLLAVTALVAQRIQNRITADSADLRQAELNANTAVELALLTMKQNANWRSAQPHGRWFTNRSTTAGTCSVEVTDPIDANLANNADEPVLVRGIGNSGRAEQRLELMIDPRREPLGCLRCAVAAGGAINLNNDTLRTGGLISAHQVSATASQVYGTVEAVTISGSTYYGSTSQIPAARRPAMPDWTTVFNHYRTNGTELNINSLLSTTSSNFARNSSIESGTTHWAGTAPGLNATAQISQSNEWARTGTNSLRVANRTHWSAGAIQHIEHFVKPGQQYDFSVFARVSGLVGTRWFCITLHTKGTGDSSPSVVTSPSALASVLLGINLPVANVTGRLTVPTWSGDLEYAYIKVSDDATSASTTDFWLDDLTITEVCSGRYIYRQVLGPGVNTLYSGAPTNPQGLYWINCNGARLTIERSRIVGTLLVLNPGAGSCIAPGPINWAPATPGYPALLVDATTASTANFAILARNRALSEVENGVNYNPPGAPHEQFAQDTDTNDTYRSAIRGLVAVRNNVTYANWPLVRGQIIVGGDISNSSGELEVEYLPESLLNPPPGFLAPYSYPRRPASTRKAVLP